MLLQSATELSFFHSNGTGTPKAEKICITATDNNNKSEHPKSGLLGINVINKHSFSYLAMPRIGNDMCCQPKVQKLSPIDATRAAHEMAVVERLG